MTDANGTCRSDSGRQKFEGELLALESDLRKYAMFLTRDLASVDDLVQDAFARALREWKNYIPDSNLKAWVCTLMRNMFLSERRRNKFRAPWDPDVAERTLTSGGKTSEAEAALDFQRMLRCLACLPKDQSDALVAVGYLGLSYDDAAKQLDTNVGTMKSRISRGRADLARWYEGTGKIPEIGMSWFQAVTQRSSETHPACAIAKAYEELYAAYNVCPTAPSLLAEAVRKMHQRRPKTMRRVSAPKAVCI